MQTKEKSPRRKANCKPNLYLNINLKEKMKLLLILNENQEGSHADMHQTLKELVEDNILSGYKVYPFLARLRGGCSDATIEEEILNLAITYQPEYILWHHTSSLKISQETISKLRKLESNPAIGYRDGDIYHNFYDPIPRPVINLAKLCDVVFWPGYSGVVKKLQRTGSADVRYVPTATDSFRFGADRSEEIKYDVIMIGNITRSRIPFKTFPGSILRLKIADYFYKKLGSKFAVYGNGWNGPYAKGPVAMDQQHKANQSGRIAIGTHNLPAHYYFSNRLPIALTSGVPIIYKYQKGMEHIFREVDYPYFFNSIEEAWTKTEKLLDLPQEEIDRQGQEFKNFALSNLSVKSILTYVISVLNDYRLSRTTGEQIFERDNPWINMSRF